MNYIKTEINYIDFVPDRFSANVYIMITSHLLVRVALK